MSTDDIRTKPAHQFTVGLTGGIGSGKTRVANAFAERGACIIDTDVIAHELTAAGGLAIPSITEMFGLGVLSSTGAMDRVKMRASVFSDPIKKNLLESLLHPMIRAEVAHQAKIATGPYTIIVVPLLAETGHWQFSRILVVDCPPELQIQRVMQRDKLPLALIESIIAQQTTRAQRLAFATDILSNEADFGSLIPEIDRLHQYYVKLSSAN